MENSFRKEQIVKSEKYSEYRDIISALLLSEREYTFDEVDSIIKGFNERIIVNKESESL